MRLESDASDSIRIDVWADLVCPYCFLAKRELDAAIADFVASAESQSESESVSVGITWHAFQLDREAPALIEDHFATFAEKYAVSREEAIRRHDEIADFGKGLGINFDFENLRRGTTYNAHRLVQMGARRGIADAVVEEFMDGYFTRGMAIGKADSLMHMARQAGLPEVEVNEVLATDEFGYEVRAAEVTARQLMISQVPYLVFDRKYAVSGAQSKEGYLNALHYTAEHRDEEETPRSAGACGGGCGNCGCGA